METQVLRAFPDQKDRLGEWACQDYLEKRVCLESPAPRASLASLERKEPKGRKGRQACPAWESRDSPGQREIKG